MTDELYPPRLAIRDELTPEGVYRTCRCGKRAPLTAEFFHVDTTHFSGYDLECKTCANNSSYKAMRKAGKYTRTYAEQSVFNRDLEAVIDAAKRKAAQKYGWWKPSGFTPLPYWETIRETP